MPNASENATENSAQAAPVLEFVGIVTQIDTTKEAIKAQCTACGKILKDLPYSQKAHKLAVFRVLCQIFGVSDPVIAGKAWKQFEATPSAFGTNASALRQQLWPEVKSAERELVELINPLA